MKVRAFLSQKIVWVSLFSILWAIVLFTDSLPILRGGFGWDWKYKLALEPNRSLPLIAAVIVYIPIALWLLRRQAMPALLTWSILGGIFLTLAAVNIRGDILYRLFAITVSGRLGGWHMAATRISDLGSTLRNWPAFMADSVSFSTHMGISPPGQVLVYYAADRLLDHAPSASAWLAGPVRGQLCQYIGGYSNAEYASTWLGILMPVWASLAVLPLYFVGRKTFGGQAAGWSVVWWPLIPSFLSFAPVLNTFYPVLSLIMMGLVLEGLRRNHMAWIFAAGLLASVMTFLTFTFLPLLLFAGLLALGFYRWKRTDSADPRSKWHWPLRVGLWFGVGLSIVWIIAYMTSGLKLWDVWVEAQRAHLALDRPYWPWLILHLNDFFMFTGWPIALLAGAGLVYVIRRLRAHQKTEESDLVILAAALTTLLLDISGTLRGESGRILLFLSPWLLFAAAYAIRADLKLGWTLTVLQGLMAIVILLSLFTQRLEFKAHAAPVPPVVSAPANAKNRLTNADFGDVVRLESYAGGIETQNGGQILLLWLAWKDLQPTNVTYDLAITPVASNGAAMPATDRIAPFQDEYPTTCWKPEDGTLVDRIKVALPASASGEWSVRLSLVDQQTGRPLQAASADGTPVTELILGPFH